MLLKVYLMIYTNIINFLVGHYLYHEGVGITGLKTDYPKYVSLKSDALNLIKLGGASTH